MEETIVLLNLLGTLHDSSTIPKYVGNFEKYSLEEISRRLERVEYDESMMNFIGVFEWSVDYLTDDWKSCILKNFRENSVG